MIFSCARCSEPFKDKCPPHCPKCGSLAIHGSADPDPKPSEIRRHTAGPNSALRDDIGKPPLDQLVPEAIRQEALVFAYGEARYDKFNWCKGHPWTQPLASALRHLFAFRDGEDLDPESGLSHLAHARANLAILFFCLQYHPDLDDRHDTQKIACAAYAARHGEGS
jgi:hypothetical protein